MDVPVAGEALAFEGWRFDPGAGGLLRQGRSSGLFLGLVSKDAIMDTVWPNVVVEPNNLTVQIAALRRVLDVGRAGDRCIQTVPGRGYRFVLRVSRLGEAEHDLLFAPIAPPAAPVPSRRLRWHWSARDRVRSRSPCCWLPRHGMAARLPRRHRPRVCRSSYCRSRTSAAIPGTNTWPTASPTI